MSLITITMALLGSNIPVSHESVTVSQHAQYQDSESKAAKWNSATNQLTPVLTVTSLKAYCSPITQFNRFSQDMKNRGSGITALNSPVEGSLQTTLVASPAHTNTPKANMLWKYCNTKH